MVVMIKGVFGWALKSQKFFPKSILSKAKFLS